VNKGENAMADEDVQEVTDESLDVNEEKADPSILSELDIPDDLLTEKKDGEDKDKKEEVVDDKGGKQYQELSEKCKGMEDELSKLKKDKSDLKIALHEARQERKKNKEKDAEEFLSDADILKIMEEHKGDDGVTLNALKHVMARESKKSKTEIVDEVQTKQRATMFNNALRSKLGADFEDESSDLRQSINKAKDFLNVTDHPFSDAIGAAAVVFDQLPHLLKMQYEKGKRDAMDGKTEKNRVSGIEKGKSLFDGAKRTDGGTDKQAIPKSALETAERLGFKPGTRVFKTYVNQILKTKAA